MTVTIKSNLKSSVFSVSSILILCYVGLVGYLFQDFSIPTRYIMFVALFSTTILIVVARKTIGNNADKIGGFSWLMASKKERVRSIFTDLVVNSVRAKWMSWIVTSWLIVNFANRFDKIPDNIYIYFTLFLTAIALFTQVETIKMIPRIKMSIED